MKLTFGSFRVLMVGAVLSVHSMLAIGQTSEYPLTQIKLVVPVPPGGAADFVARLIAQKMSDSMKQIVVVENVGGATGTIAAAQVARSKPDGYTLLLSSSTTHATAPAFFNNLTYDPIKSFSHLGLMATVPAVAVVHKDVPARNIKELIEYTKANPNKLNYASSGNGSPLNFWAEMFKISTGSSLQHVPYKGSGPAVVDLIAGRVHVMFDGLPAQLSNIKAGNTRPLAILHPERLGSLPETPTMAQEGYPDVVGGLWYGFSGPSGLPPEVVLKLNKEFERISKLPEIIEAFNSRGVLVTHLDSTRYVQFIMNENDKYKKISQQANVKDQ
jgi:tripartite-type tricarboxylate transporter receptor subunit TctC